MAKRKPRAKKPRVTKIQQICDYMTEYPDESAKDVMEKFNAHTSQISVARRRIREANDAAMASVLPKGNGEDVYVYEIQRDVRTIKKMGVSRARRVIQLIESIQGG